MLLWPVTKVESQSVNVRLRFAGERRHSSHSLVILGGEVEESLLHGLRMDPAISQLSGSIRTALNHISRPWYSRKVNFTIAAAYCVLQTLERTAPKRGPGA